MYARTLYMVIGYIEDLTKPQNSQKFVGGCLHGKGGLLSNTVLVAKCLSIRILILQCLFSVDPQSFNMISYHAYM